MILCPGRPVPIRLSLLTVLLCLAVAPAAVLGQTSGAPVAFGSLKSDPTLPVEVTSDQLRMNQTEGTGLFTGDVVVGQGVLRMTSAELLVEYDSAGNAISRMHATGGVTLFNGVETAESDEAVYAVPDGIVVMTGNVLLTQGTSAISGTRLNIDLNAGTGLMEGRVTTVFVPASASP